MAIESPVSIFQLCLSIVLTFLIAPFRCGNGLSNLSWASGQEDQTLLHANNKGTDQPGHLRSLFSTFFIYIVLSGKYSSQTCSMSSFNVLASLCI